MIYKSYQIENKIETLKQNINLIYGENIGLINDFRIKIKKHYKDCTVLNFTQDEILKNENLFYNEVNNDSLFGGEKIIFILETSEKIFKFIENISIKKINNKVFLFARELEKKSKLRSLFEKDKDKIIIPCYKDNDLTIKNIITRSLREYSGLTTQIISMIHENSSNDRIKLNNEILKIKTFFTDKQIKLNHLQKLLNLKEEEDFNLLRDASLSGENLKTNELLNSDILEKEKMPFYIASINQRLSRLKELDNKNTPDAIDNLKPPIFWKDKPIFLQQSKIWNKKKLNLALAKIYEAETKIKSNSNLNNEIIFKKFLIDICYLANAA
tara:strand:+ start:1691 stop:2671 length:981 start_codon:yes stop_codon:yes gene_type:complete